MDARLVNPFMRALAHVVDTMVELPLQWGPPEVALRGEAPHEINALIHLSGNPQGCVVISMTEPLARRIVGALWGDTPEELDADGLDALGEVANMVAGNAKNKLPWGGGTLSPPRVFRERGAVVYPPGVPVLRLPCRLAEAPLVLDIALQGAGPG
jgi:chemotaxis protein CheX